MYSTRINPLHWKTYFQNMHEECQNISPTGTAHHSFCHQPSFKNRLLEPKHTFDMTRTLLYSVNSYIKLFNYAPSLVLFFLFWFGLVLVKELAYNALIGDTLSYHENWSRSLTIKILKGDSWDISQEGASNTVFYT